MPEDTGLRVKIAKNSKLLAQHQILIDQLFVIVTRVDARVDGVVETIEGILGPGEGPRLRESLIRHEFARMDSFLLMAEMVEPETAARMRLLFTEMMKREGKA